MEQGFKNKISNEELAELPVGRFEGEIVVVTDADQVNKACDYLLKQKALGFDTETRPVFRAGIVHNVALLQLSTEERCYLFRLCAMRLDKAVLKVLENKSIVKVGLDLPGDIRGLKRERIFSPKAFIDLQSIVGGYGIEELGLRKLAAVTLGVRISKAQRLSNWEASELTPAQKNYAATDAWVSLKVYLRLMEEEIALGAK